MVSFCLSQVSQASKVWGEVPLPEDLESEKDVQAYLSLLDDDEDFVADGASGGGLCLKMNNNKPQQQLTLIH